MKKKTRKPLYTFDEYKIKYPYGGTSTNIVGEQPISTMQPIYSTGVDNNYNTLQAPQGIPNQTISTVPTSNTRGISSNKANSYAGQAAGGLRVVESSTGLKSEYPMDNNTKTTQVVDSVAAATPIGGYLALGDVAGDMVEAGTSKSDSSFVRGLGYQTKGSMSPWEEWKTTFKGYGKESAGTSIGKTFLNLSAPGMSSIWSGFDNEKKINAEEKKQQEDRIQYISEDSTMQAAYGGYLKKKFQNGGEEIPQMPMEGFMQDNLTDFKDNRFMPHPMGGVSITKNQDGSQDEVEQNEYKHTSKDGSSFIFSDKLGMVDGKPIMLKQGQKPPKGFVSMAEEARKVGKKVTNKKYS